MPNNFNPYGNNYNPYGMNNFNSYGNNYNQPNNQAMQLNQYAFVNGIEGAKSYQMQPNQTIMLMDSDAPVCYMKTTNSIGQASLRYFKLTEVTENDLKPSNVATSQSTAEYVLKADFDILSKKVDSLLGRLEKPFKKENSKPKED